MILVWQAIILLEPISKMHLTRQRRAGAQWSANIRGGLKTDSKYSNTNVVYSVVESVCALPLDVIYYF